MQLFRRPFIDSLIYLLGRIVKAKIMTHTKRAVDYHNRGATNKRYAD